MDYNIAEINLLGTGGNYGESLLIHIGNNEWIVIDSCRDPYTKKILPLELIKNKSIDSEQIKFIICTHWHDDHIKGISEIFKYATNAELVFSRVSDPRKFFQMLSYDYEKLNYHATNISTEEFNKCVELLEKRDKIFIDASIDRNIYSTFIQGEAIEIHTLSPSDYSAQLFDKHLSYLMKEFVDTNKEIPEEIPEVNPNHRSVVLLLKLGRHNMILGADLELVENDDRLGWKNILNHSQTLKSIDKPIYIKIPHHGSENGFVSELWDNILVEGVTSGLTPWKLGKKELPKEEMINKYKSYTDELFITSSPNQSNKPKNREREIEKDINRLVNKISELRFRYGIIEARIDITDKDSEWDIKTYGTAIKL